MHIDITTVLLSTPTIVKPTAQNDDVDIMTMMLPCQHGLTST